VKEVSDSASSENKSTEQVQTFYNEEKWNRINEAEIELLGDDVKKLYEQKIRDLDSKGY